MPPQRKRDDAPSAGDYPWLIMVYQAGDNNLTEDMVLALQDLAAEGGSLQGSRIVAQLDPSGFGLSTQRYDFGSKAPGKPLDEYRDPDSSPSEVNTGTREALQDFIKWADDKCWVDQERTRKWDYRHLLILSGHGSGTTEDFLLKDEASGDSLTVDELREALSAVRTILQHGRSKPRKKIDVLGLDACYMSMGEVAYEIRDSVDVMVGAEGLEPAFGWPYRRILARARAFLDKAGKKARNKARDKAPEPKPLHMTPEKLAGAIVEEYVDHYADYDRSAGRSVDLAAMDLGKTENVKVAFGLLVAALKGFGKADHEKLLLSHWYAQTYKYDQFVDLADLCERMKIQFKDRPGIVRKCDKVIRAICGPVPGGKPCVIKSGCSGFASQYSRGLSIYFPWAVVSPDYGNLRFAERTGWHRFLQKHVKATRRLPRYRVEFSLPTSLTGRRNALEKLLKKAKRSHRLPDAEVIPEVPRDILGRFMGLGWVRGGRPEIAALSGAKTKIGDRVVARVVRRVAETDILDEEVPREITRRVVQAGSLRDLDSRHTNGTRHTDHTRSLDDREKALKNLPPAIGKAYVPKRRGKTA